MVDVKAALWIGWSNPKLTLKALHLKDGIQATVKVYYVWSSWNKFDGKVCLRKGEVECSLIIHFFEIEKQNLRLFKLEMLKLYSKE